MATVSIPDLLKAAERPLALFLDDALRSVREDYFDSVVKPFVETSTRRDPGLFQEYKGEERLIDGRGQVKTSFTQCDLQFLTQFFEFAVKDQRRHTNPKVVYPDLCEFLPITRAAIITKILAVRNIRNDWAHDRKSDQDQHKQMIDIAKLLDLFKEEIQHVVHEKPALFRPETKIAVDAYVAELIALHRKTAGSLGANQAVGDMVTAPPSVLYTNWSLWRNVILGVSALALIGVLARLNFSSSKPTQCLTILAIGPLPFEGQQLFMDHLVRLSNQSMDYWRVYVVSGSEASIDTVVTRLDSVDIRSNLLPVVTRVQGVISLMQYRSLFIESIAQLKRAKKDKLNPTLMILGNLPEPTHEDSSRAMEEFDRTGRPFRVHDLSFTIKWWRDENIAPPYVMRYRRASSRDEQLVNDFATSDIMLTPKAIDLW